MPDAMTIGAMLDAITIGMTVESSMARGGRRLGAVVFGAALVVLAPEATASNGMAPRTPPVFVQEACMVAVDRSVDPVFRLEYGIPFEDTQLTPDELSDSRRYQFFAVCEDAVAVLRPFPDWISTADVQRALDGELIDEAPEPEDVLDQASAWAGCMVPLNADDARIPITCAATEGGTAWDTTNVAAGNYVIRGYTFEPGVNLWTARRGVVQVRDGEAPLVGVSLVSPATRDLVAYQDTGFQILGCASGPPGTTVTLEWASLISLGGDDDEAVWAGFSEFEVGAAPFDVLFEPPMNAVNQPVLIRGVARGPAGERWVSYAGGTLIVLPGDDASDDAAPPRSLEFCGFYDEAGSSGGSDSSGGTSSSGETGSSGGGSTRGASTDGQGSSGGDTGSGQGEAAPSEGCGCRAGRGRSPGALLFLALLWLRPRRLQASVAEAGPHVQQ